MQILQIIIQTILDFSFTDISSTIHDLSNVFYDSKNKNDISFSKIDSSTRLICRMI